jgi:hypothetical protein
MASFSIPRNKEDFILSIKYKLGYPTIPIKISDEQFDLIIYDTLEFYCKNVYDGSRQIMVPFQCVSGTLAYKFNTPNIFAVTEVLERGFYQFPYSSTYGVTESMIEFFNSIEQARTGDMVQADVALQNLNFFRKLFLPQQSWQFNYNTNTLILEQDPGDLKMAIIATQLLDMEGTSGEGTGETTNLWNNHIIKRYAMALAKMQWANAMGGALTSTVEGPGGQTIDLDRLYTQGQEELTKIEEEVNDSLGQEYFKIYIG